VEFYPLLSYFVLVRSNFSCLAPFQSPKRSLRSHISTTFLLSCALFGMNQAMASSSTQARFVQEQPQFSAGQWPDHSQELCFVASETDKYLAKGHAYDPAAIHGGKLPGLQADLARVRATLNFICQIQQQDQQAGRPSRLAQSDFLQQHFEFVRWYPDRAAAKKLSKNKPLLENIPSDKILQTKYYVRIATGSKQKSAQHTQALYGLPYDEAQLPLAQADQLGKKITRFQLGKQAIVQGALEQKPLRAPALIWLSREDLEGALLQGTAVIPSNQGYRYFNVHRHNGISYDRTLTPEQQQRYWYFKEVQSVLGYGKDADYKIPITPQVTVAGDIRHFGLGKLVLMATAENGTLHYRLNILADTGGAFDNNQFQLDWLSGYYRDWDHYYQANKHRADYSQAWFLLKKM
jgi:membrane-bound lytic murein transglycosylase